MWQKFTELARRAVFYAQEEAGKYEIDTVETEHLLLGLLREQDNVACQILSELGIRPEIVQAELLKQIARQRYMKGKGVMQLSFHTKSAIDFAYEEAQPTGGEYIGTEHLLLGLIREKAGVAGKVLAKLRAHIDAARDVLAKMQESASSAPDSSEKPTVEDKNAPGDLGVVQPASGRDVSELASTLSAFTQLLDIFRARDADGYRELFEDAARPVMLLPEGTMIKVLVMPREATGEMLRFAAYVRVLDGEFAGRAGFLRKEFFRRIGTDDAPFPPVLENKGK